ncbi:MULTISPECIES: phenylacetic acid degradation protein [Kyrpidia]|uniref:Phenylacetic acid degradation B n=3 Tax=Kyrpidia TaxID=1129704 RepID=A0A6F9EBK6_9BACL|nr:MULTISPECIES: phenylacetic acid degradation protein [Kyrpidia]HHY66571.1 phenylacetic acid degradation protein [Alicyclobacillus sp.]ADG05960.1 phenylacetic acid degradation B [Kyrpidia tusciae DSM 2912]MBE3552873.1 phenylacetic acid degradation protein [Kyrpidia tusciae]MCL6575889.1 phenylacetic acid degradation protein [Kyrpidia sp.]CAB3392953.1 Phenylacetic acid degradation B [Kyrpidia spormannii]
MQLNGSAGDYEVYEVFVQYDPLEHHVHVGSVVSSSGEMALQVARENFLRRDDAVNLWVVPRGQVFATSYEDADFFAKEMDHSYREASGYPENAKLWKSFKQRAIELEDLIRD